MDPALFSRQLTVRDGVAYSSDAAAVSYPECGHDVCFALEDASFWFRHRNNCLSEVVRIHGENGVFLDAGGGNGFVAKRLQDDGVDVVLLEPGERGCRHARSRGLQHILCADLQHAGLRDGAVSMVGLFDVLEHIEQEQAFLAQVSRVLRARGLVFLTVPAYPWLWSREDDEAGHFRRYTRRSLAAALVGAGFRIEYATYIFSVLPAGVLACRVTPYRLGLQQRVTTDPHTAARQHRGGGGAVTRILDRVWAWELARIRRRQAIWTGGSCLVVARKAA